MHCSSLSSFRHAAGRTCTNLECHRSPWQWKITCRLLEVSTQKWFVQLLLKFYWLKHITWSYLTQRTWGSIMLHMSKKKIRIFMRMFLMTARGLRRAASPKVMHLPTSSVKGRALIAGQGPHPIQDNSEGQPSFTSFQRGWLRPLLRLHHGPNSPSVQLCFPQFLSMRYCFQKRFLKNLLLLISISEAVLWGSQSATLHNICPWIIWNIVLCVFKLYVNDIVIHILQFAFPLHIMFLRFIHLISVALICLFLLFFWKIPQFTCLLSY